MLRPTLRLMLTFNLVMSTIRISQVMCLILIRRLTILLRSRSLVDTSIPVLVNGWGSIDGCQYDCV